VKKSIRTNKNGASVFTPLSAKNETMIIAIEFDGGIVTNSYPNIGEELPFAHYIIEQLKMRGHQTILVTDRTGRELKDAIHFCEGKEYLFDSVLDGYSDRSKLSRDKNSGEDLLLVTESVLKQYNSWINLYWKLYPEEYDYARLRSSGIKKSKRRWKNLFKKRIRGNV